MSIRSVISNDGNTWTDLKVHSVMSVIPMSSVDYNTGANNIVNNDFVTRIGTLTATERAGQWVVNRPGNLNALIVNYGADPSTSVKFTVRKNGVDTALTVTLTSPVQVGADATHYVPVVAGDLISLKCFDNGGATLSTLVASYSLN